MDTVSASVARQTLPAQLDRVEAGGEVAITRHGRVVALLVSPHSVRAGARSAAWEQADRIAELLEQARHRPIPRRGLAPGRAEELVDRIRADRDAD